MLHKELSYISPRKCRALTIDSADGFEDLRKIGINITKDSAVEMLKGLKAMGFDSSDFGMDDALPALVTAANIPAYQQFLQTWLPGFVQIVTQARKIDEFIGKQTIASWEDEEVVQGTLELTGNALPYGDFTNVPLSSWTNTYERRSIVRFEEGLRVGKLEEARSAKMQINDGQQKRDGAAIALDIQRNKVGFFGYNGGANRTYGFLNDPNLPSYQTVAASGSGSSTFWSSKTMLEIVADLRVAFSGLRTQSGDLIDPNTAAITLGVSSDAIDYLNVVSDLGYSVLDWVNRNYKNVRVVSAPELNDANGGENVFYVYAESVSDTSTDGGRVWNQIVPAQFQVVGVEQRSKYYVEDYTNALAGVLLKRPWAVARWTGI